MDFVGDPHGPTEFLGDPGRSGPCGSGRVRVVEFSYNTTTTTTTTKGGNVTSARWQVTPSDPMWHVSSRSGVAALRTAIHSLLTYLLTLLGSRGVPVEVEANRPASRLAR